MYGPFEPTQDNVLGWYDGDLVEAFYDLTQKPRSAFGLINPDLDEAGGGYVVVVLADFVS